MTPLADTATEALHAAPAQGKMCAHALVTGACTQVTTLADTDKAALHPATPAQGKLSAHALVTRACTQVTTPSLDDVGSYDVGGTASTCERFWRPNTVQEEDPLDLPPGLVAVKEELSDDEEGEDSDSS